MDKFKFNLSVWEGEEGGISNLVVEVPPEVNGDDHLTSKNWGGGGVHIPACTCNLEEGWE